MSVPETWWTLICGYGFRRTGRTCCIDLRIRRLLSGGQRRGSAAVTRAADYNELSNMYSLTDWRGLESWRISSHGSGRG
jgi:hypothetical protein